MSIYTARYANKRLREDGYFPVGISIGSPRFKLGYELREQCYALAPKGYMLKMEYAPYRVEYFKKLEAIGTGKIIEIVRNLEKRAKAEGKSLVLLCFEDIRKPENWCHRRLFAEWWEAKTGESIEELEEVEVVKAKPTPIPTPAKEEEQISLF